MKGGEVERLSCLQHIPPAQVTAAATGALQVTAVAPQQIEKVAPLQVRVVDQRQMAAGSLQQHNVQVNNNPIRRSPNAEEEESAATAAAAVAVPLLNNAIQRNNTHNRISKMSDQVIFSIDSESLNETSESMDESTSHNDNDDAPVLPLAASPSKKLVYHFTYFRFPETQGLDICVPIEASCNGVARFKVIDHSYSVWLKMDDGFDEENVKIHTDLVASFLNVSVKEYEATVKGMKKSEQKEYRNSLAIRFLDFIGIFNATRIAAAIDATTCSHEESSSNQVNQPIIEFLNYADENMEL
jgi:hypothetical protein